MLQFTQTVEDTKFIFVLEDTTLRVTRRYNSNCYNYEHSINEDTSVSEFARLIERFKSMPSEMWQKTDVKHINQDGELSAKNR